MSVTGMDQVLANLQNWQREIERRAGQAMEEIVASLEGWAKAEHAYTDRTGNLTSSIRGEITEASAALVRGVLTAGMDYAVFVNAVKDGKWAFLWPVIEAHKDDILAILKRRLEG